MVASKSVIAQSIETLKAPRAPDQLAVGGDPEGIAVNTATNKIYILNPGNGTVTVIDSKSGTIKNIPVGLGYSGSCPYCIGVDSRKNKIYVANTISDTVSVIDGNSDTVQKTVPVGRYPTFILVTPNPSEIRLPNRIGETCCKIYVANTISDTVSVIDGNSDTVQKTVPVGRYPTFIYTTSNQTYVASGDSVSVIDHTDTLSKMIPLPAYDQTLPLLNAIAYYTYHGPLAMYVNETEIYVLDYNTKNAYRIAGNGTVMPINWTSSYLNYTFPPGVVRDPLIPGILEKIYRLNRDNGAVSIIVSCTQLRHAEELVLEPGNYAEDSTTGIGSSSKHATLLYLSEVYSSRTTPWLYSD